MSLPIFQYIMNSIVKGLDGVKIYQDDVIIHAFDKFTHDNQLFIIIDAF